MCTVTVRLRQAKVEDREFLFELHRASLGPVIEATWGPWDDTQQRQFHDAWFEPSRLFIVLTDDEPAGVVDAYRRPDGTVYLSRLELLPAFQNLGIGTALVHQLVAQAGSSGPAVIELDVLEQNEGARRLYERLGFTVVKDMPPKQRMRLAVAPTGPHPAPMWQGLDDGD